MKVWGICRNGRASPIVCQRVDHPFAKWFCSSTATSFQSPSGPHTPRSSTGILSPQACFQVKSSLDDFAHVAELVGRQLAPWGEDAAGRGQVLEGLVRLQQTQVRVVQGMRRQLLRTLVVGDHKDDAGLNTKQKKTAKLQCFSQSRDVLSRHHGRNTVVYDCTTSFWKFVDGLDFKMFCDTQRPE